MHDTRTTQYYSMPRWLVDSSCIYIYIYQTTDIWMCVHDRQYIDLWCSNTNSKHSQQSNIIAAVRELRQITNAYVFTQLPMARVCVCVRQHLCITAVNDCTRETITYTDRYTHTHTHTHTHTPITLHIYIYNHHRGGSQPPM
eukprot:GHVQ01042254.1.p1 GENE.GHVQ01042254.1~~GHVQ01042254.1.p1  ORF type:complete len:142 (-),score=30.94 GHVQ01042254.1:84-509(-)